MSLDVENQKITGFDLGVSLRLTFTLLLRVAAS